MPDRYLRGEVYSVSLDPVEGHEQAGMRPCVIVSHNRVNALASDLCVVLPITSQMRSGSPLRIDVIPPEGGLTLPSQILCQQIRSVSHRRIGALWGSVGNATLAEVERVLKLILALDTH